MGKTRPPKGRKAKARKGAYILAGGAARHRSGTHPKNRHITPHWLVVLVQLCLGGFIHFDPCTEPENPTGAMYYVCRPANGLTSQFWGLARSIFCNPPYSTVEPWIDKCIEAASNGAKIIMLLPVRTDAAYHQRVLEAATDSVLIRGRLKFMSPDGEESGSAPFGSMLVGLNHSVADLAHLGILVAPKTAVK